LGSLDYSGANPKVKLAVELWGRSFSISVDEQTPRSSVHFAAFLKKFEISITPVAPFEKDPVAQSLVSVRHSQLLIAHL
jgi:hypothetical protein